MSADRSAMRTARHLLVVAHTGREDSLQAGVRVCRELIAAGLVPVVSEDERAGLLAAAPDLEPLHLLGVDVATTELELVIVLGGDGTILRAAELARASTAPLLGVNLGHVGFLAEAERDDLAAAVTRALARDYEVEERMTLSVRVKHQGEVVWESWALNDASVEKASRERSIEVAIEVDGRPLSTFGCDGVVMSTPTGSTAYSFSAGGPIVWPTVEALLMVPLSAARALRSPARRRAGFPAGGRVARALRGHRRGLVRRAPHLRPAAPARASSCAARPIRCGWRG